MLKIRTCPTCGSKRIRLVREAVIRSFRGKRYQVPDVEFHACPNCSEKLYGREAMRKLETFQPKRYLRNETIGDRVGHLAGTLKGLPHDLSTNKKHMKGFGAS